jgi:hypothetical protein
MAKATQQGQSRPRFPSSKNNNVKERVDPLNRRLPLANQAIKPTYPEERTHRAEPVGGASEDCI